MNTYRLWAEDAAGATGSDNPSAIRFDESNHREENEMLTKTATKQLRRAIKTRLGLNDRQAGAIIDRNWFTTPEGSLRDCVVLLNDSVSVNPTLGIYVPGTEGYYEWVGYLNLVQDDLVRWNVMSLEDAYALPEGFRTLADSFEWVDGTVTACRPRDEDAIIVTVDFGEGLIREMAMLAEINDAPGLMRYAREKIGEKSRICFEAEPTGGRSIKSLNLPILEMICEARATNDDCVDLDDLFGPIPERIAA